MPPMPSAISSKSVDRQAQLPLGLQGYSKNTKTNAKIKCVPRNMIASGGPNAATYM